MLLEKHYADAFCKTAENFGVDPAKLSEFGRTSGLSKQAAGSGILKKLFPEVGANELRKLKPLTSRSRLTSPSRLLTALSPKVNPDNLNWFEKLFTNSHDATALTKYNPYKNGKVPEVGSVSTGSSAAPNTTVSSTRKVTRVSPGKILAALGIAGGAGGLAATGYSSSGDGEDDMALSRLYHQLNGFGPSMASRPDDIYSRIADYVRDHQKEIALAGGGLLTGALATHLLSDRG